MNLCFFLTGLQGIVWGCLGPGVRAAAGGGDAMGGMAGSCLFPLLPPSISVPSLQGLL